MTRWLSTLPPHRIGCKGRKAGTHKGIDVHAPTQSTIKKTKREDEASHVDGTASPLLIPFSFPLSDLHCIASRSSCLRLRHLGRMKPTRPRDGARGVDGLMNERERC